MLARVLGSNISTDFVNIIQGKYLGEEIHDIKNHLGLVNDKQKSFIIYFDNSDTLLANTDAHCPFEFVSFHALPQF